MMYIATARITIHLFDSRSLKDKRQVIRSILARARNQFEVAAAEVGSQEMWNLAEIGLAYVSNESAHAQEVLDEAVRSIESTRPDIELTQVITDVISVD